MDAPAPRLPVTVVAGFAGAGKSTLIDHWLRDRPAGERWALLANASAAEPSPTGAPANGRPPAGAPASPATGAYRVVGGCACCTAQASARSALVQLLRAGPWQRLIVELDGAAHPAALVDLLRRPPFDALLDVDGIVTVVDATRPGPFEAEPMHPLARAGVEVATRIVLNRAGRLADPRRAALLRRLAEAPPFGRAVDATDDGRAPWRPTPDVELPRPDRAGRERPEPDLWKPEIVYGERTVTVQWRWPADRVFDRARLQAQAAAWPARFGLAGAAGVFRTERDWYLWRLDPPASHWEACAWRLDNCLRLAFDPARLAALGPAGLARIDAALADAVNRDTP